MARTLHRRPARPQLHPAGAARTRSPRGQTLSRRKNLPPPRQVARRPTGASRCGLPAASAAAKHEAGPPARRWRPAGVSGRSPSLRRRPRVPTRPLLPAPGDGHMV